jgi:sulfane dehydrogenase subunit SoxC
MNEDAMNKTPLHRRAFLTAAGAALATPAMAQTNAPDPLIVKVQPWANGLGDGVVDKPYGVPSKFEADVIRRDVEWLTVRKESSVSFTPLHALDGVITPNGLCFERHHGGVAHIAPDKHRLMIHGLVDKPLVFTMDELKRMPGRVNRAYFLECAANTGMEWKGAQLNGCQFTHGMVHNVWYVGLPLKVLFERAGVKPNGKWLLAEGGDASLMTRSIPMQKALDDCMIAWNMNGEALRPEQGYPLRLVVPGWEGNMWIKWLRRLEIGDQPWEQREETSKYTDLLPDGRARHFTWVMDAKSIVTNPSPQAPLRAKGPQVLSGLAWSGRGSIKRVDVSFDGGRNWVSARIDGPVMPLSFVRFYVEFDWDGRELLIQSRAMDDTGYVQPTKDELRKARGLNSIYHNNGVQTWLVRGDGETENVEIS